jgi:hypothetical protein
LPDLIGRRRAVPVALLAAAIILSIVPATASTTTAPAGINRFLYALGEVESGGNYQARNATSGAYGKYQIMPSNWPVWARLYIGTSSAPQTPANQERVARGKVTALYRWLDSWPNVAHWWLTGSGETNHALWSASSRLYVSRIMAIYRATTAPSDTAVPTTVALRARHVGQSSASIAYAGGWAMARFGGYTGGKVKYSIHTGATATLTFTGRSVAWVGPRGPTRGRARISIDGVAVATVSLRRSAFRARATLFRTAWVTSRTHTLTIEVLGSGRPIAIDEFVVRS